MHRTAIRAVRTKLQCASRSLRPSRYGVHSLFDATGPSRIPSFLRSPTAPRTRPFSSSGSPVLRNSSSSGGRNSNSGSRSHSAPREPLHASMFFRRTTITLASALVGYGAWYSYNGNGTDMASRGYSNAAKPAPGDAVPTRSVLVIGADELKTGTYVGEGPISKTTDNGQIVVEMLSPDLATQKLRKMEESFFVNRGQGVVRYDVSQLPSNSPIEDDHVEKIVEVPVKGGNGSSDWMFWGVFDGHSGWATSATLRQALVGAVGGELNKTYKAAAGLAPSPEAIDAAIKDGFLLLDDEIVNQSVQRVLQSNSKMIAAETLAAAFAGSCALLSFYDSTSKLLRVACTGDSRAVLGRKSASGKWTATPLSVDQTGSNPDEVIRLRKEHPNEEPVRNGRILGGLEPSRAFGDARYKWTQDITDRLRGKFFARPAPTLLKTPPYVTAEPVITTTKIEPEKGDFVILATDGLWEMLTNEEVVGLVGKWIESQQSSTSNGQFNSVWARLFGSSKGGELPVESKQGQTEGGQKSPEDLMRRRGLESGKDRFVVVDKNVATHIVRNALGGSNQEQVSALLTLPAPTSRRYRDDLTVQVIFFGYGDKTGDVVVNREATAESKLPEPRAKL